MDRTHPLARWLAPALLLALLAGVARPALAAPEAAPQPQQPVWPAVPPVASYEIAVALDPQTHLLTGHETITYVNRTSDTIPNLAFHLYLNAFRSEDTVFMRESGRGGRAFGSDPALRGWSEVDALRLAGGMDLLPSTTINETVMITTLPQPLLPGESLTVTLGFRAKLPRVSSRTGFAGNFHMVGQWFPKLGVYQQGKGWNAHPFHANSEFFADFGTYDVAITVPEGYVVGATGLPAGREAHPDGTVTQRYHAEAVIDFAWTAWPEFREAHRQIGPTEVVLLYVPDHEKYVERYLDAAETCLDSYGAWYGPYPYPRLTLVDVPADASGAGGMEYPTLVTAGPPMPFPLNLLEGPFPETVTVHEIAHQWWQSTVATNEFEEPWLDEGFAEYSTSRLMDLVYPPGAKARRLGALGGSHLAMDRIGYLVMPDLPMYGRAWDFSALEYGIAAYAKPCVVLTTMERLVGEERWLAVMRTYYQRYAFGHPTTEDFLAIVAQVAGEQARAQLEPSVYTDGVVDYAVTGLGCTREKETYHCEVTTSRLGQVPLPVEVEVAFADGRTTRERWDGQDKQKTYLYAGPVPLAWAQVDPDQRLPLDVSPHNNSLTYRAQAGPLVRISSQWLFALEHLILTIGGLW